MAAWPIEELVLRPLLTVLLAVAVPGLVRRGLLLVMAPRRHEHPFEQAREAAPIVRAAGAAAVVEVVVFVGLGATALAPPLAAGRPVLSAALAATCGWAVLLSGVAASRIDVGQAELPNPRARVALALRLRFGLLSVTVMQVLLSGLPLAQWLGVAGALALVTALDVLVLALAPRAALALGVFRPAPARVSALVEEACRRLGVRPAFAAIVPSEGAAVANAWAFPLARVVLVSSHLLALDEEALRAVIAHEVEHLAEPKAMGVLRVVGIAALLSYLPLLGHGDVTREVIRSAAVVGLFGSASMLVARRLARRMEERADHGANASGPGLARALLYLQQVNLIPVVPGARRAVHPDLYDRLVAAGHDPGERPAPPPRGGIAGVLFGLGLVLAVVLVERGTRIEPDAIATTSLESAWWRLRAVPTDGAAMLAVAWSDASRGDVRRGRERIDEAERMGAPAAEIAEARAELLAQEDDCPGAWAAFEEALRVRAEARFAAGELPDVELGGWHMPPSMVEHCAGE